MNTNQIVEGVKYLSIHDVPYRVIAIKEDEVKATCEVGRSHSFKMPIERFAESMKQAIG